MKELDLRSLRDPLLVSPSLQVLYVAENGCDFFWKFLEEIKTTCVDAIPFQAGCFYRFDEIFCDESKHYN